MRIHSVVVIALLGACISNPDPREPTLDATARRGHGGWIVATSRAGAIVQGELISIDGDRLHLLVWGPRGETLTYVPTAEVARAQLYTYDSESGFGAWGLLGSLSTVSHGFFAVLSFPVWVLTAGTIAAIESRHVRLEYPDDPWSKLAAWARFPQGLPRGVVHADGRFRRAAGEGAGADRRAHAGPIFGVAVHPNGSQVHTASADKTVKVFDVGSGKVVRSLAGHTDA
ncbi:MAG: hypothetical protein M3680_35745, partial [Myxococcota bacterium]|nr:hypothetical protein [Myxococcota bacterium]